MPLPTVYPTRKKWYPVAGVVKQDSIDQHWNDYIKLNRRKFYIIDDFDKDFFDRLGSHWKEIGVEMSKYCTAKLRELIKERAYVSYASHSFLGAWYERTLSFPNVFRTYVRLENNRLTFRVEFFYERLLMSDYDVERDQPLGAHTSLSGKDMRKDMPDILNTPVIIYKNLDFESQVGVSRKKRKYRFSMLNKTAVGKREGRWYEVFDKWFRTEGYDYFKKLCKERGLI